ncbi:hypothetical protein [Paraburkholderia sp. BCC1886]|uniref:hypothetical protein n=1 Tax=Paraburkholderia sp. BCC1886 TaxID=2562670 RepID=UPI00118426C5|nr:hypothetical protein [Paraburkholderia sp. BCC1886]
MRPDHTASEFAQTQPLLSATLDSTDAALQSPQAGALSRVTFCFAWLFGLEPFLTGALDDSPRSRLDRH